MLAVRNYALRPFMDRQYYENYLYVSRWVAASQHHFQTSTNLSKFEGIEADKQQCHHESPYGKRHAVHNLGVARDEPPMPEFSLEHEAAFHVNVGSKGHLPA